MLFRSADLQLALLAVAQVLRGDVGLPVEPHAVENRVGLLELLVEHNMDIVMDVSDRIVVLNQGAVIADDVPENIRGDPDVQEAYLGGYEPGDLQKKRAKRAGDDTEGKTA